MNPKIIFQRQEDNSYLLEQLSDDRLSNFIGKLLSNDSGTHWIKKELESQKDTHNEIQASGYIICGHECCEDDITILDTNILCKASRYEQKLEFSKSKLIELLDEWQKLNCLKADRIELFSIIYKNKFELKVL